MKTETQKTNVPEFLTRAELARRWSVCIETLKRREKAGILHPLRMGPRLKRYRMEEVEQIERDAAKVGGAR